MRAINLVCGVVLVSSLAARWADVNAQTRSAEGTIVGSVRQEGSSLMLSDVRISVWTADAIQAKQAYTTVTDSNGRFSVVNVAPGHYSVRAERSGYVGPQDPKTRLAASFFQNFGVQTTPSFALPYAAITVEVRNGLQATANLSLVATGTIRGRVVTTDGRPVVNAHIDVLELSYLAGEKRLERRPGNIESDDRGEFVATALPPAQYYVRASTNAGSYPPTYFPAAVSASAAVPVTIRDATTSTNIEIRLQPTTTVKVTGRLLGPDGLQTTAVSRLYLTRANLTGPAEPPLLFPNVANDKSDGNFEIRGVTAGTYTLFPVVADASGREYTTGSALVVNETDRTDIVISFPPRHTLSVVALGDGWDKLTEVSLERPYSFPHLSGETGKTWKTQGLGFGGTFTFQDVAEGEYRINVAGLSNGSYVSEIKHDGHSILESGVLIVDAQVQKLEVTVRRGSGSLEGLQVVSQGGVPRRGIAVLVPEATRRNNPLFYQRTSIDETGHFVLRNVPPGDYTVFAFDSIEAGFEGTREFLELYGGQGKSVRINPESRTQVVSLHMIERK